MILKHLQLNSFRNYTKSDFTFSPGVTIIIGPNASGKTNLLEAIFLLATGKSFRAEFDREMIAFGKEIGRVKGAIELSSDQAIELEIVITGGEVMGVKTPIKKYLVNGVGKRLLDFGGQLKVVLFWPEDLELVTDSPTIRRRYLDFVLSQIDREYRRNLISYEKGLKQRNKVLEAIRDKGAHRHQLIFWDQLVIKTGGYITKKREEYINYLNSCQLSVISCQLEKYQLVYERSIISSARLGQYSEAEIATGTTLVGPHRDDIKFKIKNEKLKIKSISVKPEDTERTKETVEVEELRSLSHFGSRGEQRLAILWLKLGELAYIEETTGEKPVLLLDDIFSELDHRHRKIIFEVIGNQQTIITTTDLHLVEKDKLKDVELRKLS